MGEKLNHFFSGFPATGGKRCHFVYDFETLALLFERAGFETVERKAYRDSAIEQIETIDNRPEQMFFLEARKAAGVPAAVVDPEALVRDAEALWAGGDRERAWQRYLKALRLDPTNIASAVSIGRRMLEVGAANDARRLFASVVEAAPNNADNATTKRII